MAKRGHFWIFKKLANSNEQIAKKMQKTSIFRQFGPKRPILDSFWPKWVKREFFQKRAWKIFVALTSPNWKVSEKSNEQFSSNSVTYGRTDARTHVNPYVSNDSWNIFPNLFNPKFIWNFREKVWHKYIRMDVTPKVVTNSWFRDQKIIQF